AGKLCRSGSVGGRRPAMAATLTLRLWEMSDMVGGLEERAARQRRGQREKRDGEHDQPSHHEDGNGIDAALGTGNCGYRFALGGCGENRHERNMGANLQRAHHPGKWPPGLLSRRGWARVEKV